MATQKIKGQDVKIFIGADEVGCATDISITSDRTIIEGVCRDDNDGMDRAPGTMQWNASVSGFVIYTNDFSLEEIFDAYNAGTEVTVKIGTVTTGDFQLEGDGFVSSLNPTANIDEFYTYSFDISGQGKLRKTTATA